MKRLTVLLLLVFARPLHADCVAVAEANFQSTNNYALTYRVFGATASPTGCSGVLVQYRWDNGSWSPLQGGFVYTVDESYSEGHPCWAPGEHTLDVHVECVKSAPDGSCPQDVPADAHASVFVEHSIAFVDAHPTGIPQGGAVNLQTTVAWQDEWLLNVDLKAYAEMTKTRSTVQSGHTTGVDGNGNATWSASYDPNQPWIKVTAQACDKYKFKILSFSDNKCCCGSEGKADCTGLPIRMSNGNMRFTDSDPLPGMSLSRTYDSSNSDTGWFGPGWTSPLDEWLRTEREVNGSTTVAIGTGGDDRFFFNNQNGAFEQLWPEGPSSSSLRSDGGGEYVLREFGSTTERYFSSLGRLYKTRDVRNGRETAFLYDANGLIVSVVDSWGNWSWSITTDVSHHITSIAIPGTSIVWTYTYSSGVLVSAQESGTAWRTYTYAGGVLTDVNDGAGNLIESHAYGTNGATSSIGQTDDITSITYNNTTSDPLVRYTHVTMATGATVDYYQRFVGGRYRTERVDGGCTSCTSRNAVYAYDPSGHLLREQNARGYITQRTYDGLNRIVGESTALKPDGCDPDTASDHCRLISGLGTATLTATTATVARVFTYDSVWYDRPATITSISVLNPSGTRVESMTYDPTSGEMLTHSITGWTGSTASPVQEQHTTSTALYNGAEGAAFAPGGSFLSSWLSLPQPAGTKKSIDGPRTDVNDLTTFVYYPIDNAVPGSHRGRLAAIRNAAGHITRYENYDVFGNATRIVDANSVATELTFDHLGRPLTSTLKAVSGCNTTDDPLCATDLITSRSYVPANGPLMSQTDASGNVTAYEYDSRGRSSTISRGPSASDLRERIAYSYDTATGRKSLEQYLANVSGSWVEKRRETFAYDALGELITQTHADSNSIGYTYDAIGSVETIRDENHTTANTSYAYDPAQRLASVSQTLSTAPAGYITTLYSYDTAGNLTGVTDPNGNVTTYVYDDFGRILSQTSPVTGLTTYSYDSAGNLIQTAQANGTATQRSYDALNRLVDSISSAPPRPGTNMDDEETWTYDDPITNSFGIGRLASASSLDSSTNYAYDRRGLIRQENVTIWGDSFVQSYGYDAVGNRTSIGYPSGRVVTYGYDYAGRQVTASGMFNNESADYVTSASYLPFGPLTSLSLGNGTVETRAYDQRYRPSSLQLNTAVATVVQYSYASDAVGNLTGIADVTDTAYNRTFGYDDLRRLVTANSGTGLWGNGSYIYDRMGNMLTATLGSRTRTFTYSGTTPRIDTATDNGIVTSMAYDDSGNELTGPDGPDGYTTDGRIYSPRNLLSQIVRTSRYCLGPQGEICRFYAQGTTTIDNAFDARGVLVATLLSSTVPPYPLNGWPYLFYTPELTPLDTIAQDYTSHNDVIWVSGRPIAEENVEYGGLQYILTDHLGTPILLTDTTGAITWRPEYEPFGNVYTMRVGSRTDLALRFPGQQVAFRNNSGDDESYNIFRWYRAGWGRYTQSDPLNVVGGLNLYLYVEGNPVDGSDPLGLAKIYGNWCGPDWTGGFKATWNQLTAEQRRNALPPIDALDRACEVHDKCYGSCGENFRCDARGRSECFRTCDYALTKAAYKFGGKWGNTIGAAIDRPGPRDPGPNPSDCCGGTPCPGSKTSACYTIGGTVICGVTP